MCFNIEIMIDDIDKNMKFLWDIDNFKNSKTGLYVYVPLEKY